jgi:hypothetical protein
LHCIQKARGDGQDFSLIENPLIDYTDAFNQTSLKTSIDFGPVDKTIPDLDDKNYKFLNDQTYEHDLTNLKMKLI